MKKWFPYLAVVVFFACKKSGVDVGTTLPVEQPEIENTIFSVSKINSTSSPIFPVANTPSYLLGYGYDINGIYADSSSARDQVLDMQKFGTKYPGRIILENMYTSGSPYTIVASNAEVFSERLSKRNNETSAFHSFKASLTSLSDSALSQKYSYGWAMYYVYNKRLRLATPPLDSLKNCLSTAFATDVENLTPANLIKKYGTHVLSNIKTGSKLELTYQAETKSADKELKAMIGLSRGSVAVFGLSTGQFYSGPAYINSAINQKIYYKTAGGDPNKLPQFPTNNSINPKIDFTNWFHSSTIENSSLIDINNDFGLIPLSDLVFNSVKKAAIKAYIDTYIAENTVRLIN